MKNKNIKLALLGVLLFGLSIFSLNLSETIVTNENIHDNNITNHLISAGFWNLTGSPISIDDNYPSKNWSYTTSHYDWCSGSGSWADPYIIENVTINGQGSGSCLEIFNSDAYFIIRNCSLYNSGSISDNAGILLCDVNNGKIINNNNSDNDKFGIYLDSSNNNTLSGNTANNNNYGIRLLDSYNNTLSGNTASNNSIDGIYLNRSDNNTLSGNTASNNYKGIYLWNSDNITLSGNTASNNSIDGIFFEDSNNNTLSGNTANNNNLGILFSSSNNNTLSGNTANNNTCGICLSSSNNNKLSENTANNNSKGIFLEYSNNNTLSENLMYFCSISLSGSLAEMASHSIDNTNLVNNKPVYYYANEIGLGSSNFTNAGQIILINCNNSIISGLNISDGSGIYLWNSDNNTLSGNTINNNYYGIYLWNSDSNTLSENIINNNYFGIHLVYSDSNTLSGNTANNNTCGIYLIISNNNNILYGNTINYNLYGIILDSKSNNNKIFLNHFINNEIDAEDNGINNTWDNGTIGNYWDDYVDVDANDDGIGDTPYIIPGTAGSQDNFPIWKDGDDLAPVITIIFPLPDSIFGLVAPNYNISINELNLDTIWYTLDGGGTNYTISGLTGTLNQLAWGALSESSVKIRFYANDTLGRIGFTEVSIKKDITAPIITINNPQNNDVIGATAPSFNISIEEPNLDKIWYSLNGGTNITFTGLTGTLNQTLWDALPEGNVVIKFYANDSARNIGFQEVIVVKEITQPSPPGISGYNLLFLVGIISVMVVIIIKKE